MCTTLRHKGVLASTIMQLSGHKNVQSVNNYAVASEEQQNVMCNILTNDDTVQNLPVVASTPCHSNNAHKAIEYNANVSGPSESNSVVTPTISTSVESQSMKINTEGLFNNANIYGGNFQIFVNPNTGHVPEFPNNKSLCD